MNLHRFAAAATAAATLFAAAVCFGLELYEAEGVRVIDGDTIHVDRLHLGFGVELADQRISADYDAWEATRHRFGEATTDEELQKGLRAKEDLQHLVTHERIFIYPPNRRLRTRDSFGRLLGVWRFGKDRRSVKEWMELRGNLRDQP